VCGGNGTQNNAPAGTNIFLPAILSAGKRISPTGRIGHFSQNVPPNSYFSGREKLSRKKTHLVQTTKKTDLLSVRLVVLFKKKKKNKQIFKLKRIMILAYFYYHL